MSSIPQWEYREWYPASKPPYLTKAQRRPAAHGVPCLIWPVIDGQYVAYYGTRVMDEPGWYLHGAVLGHVTHWMPLPLGPEE